MFDGINSTLDHLIDVEAECLLLGVAMQSPDKFTSFAHTVRPEHFGNGLCALLWEQMDAMTKAGQRFTALDLARSMKGNRQFSEKDVMRLYTASRPFDMAIGDVAARIVDLASRRSLVAMARELMDQTQDLSLTATDIASRASLSLARAVKGDDTGISKHEAMEQVCNHLAFEVPCYSTGLPKLDDLLGGGLYASKLYALAARKKVGKTVLMGTISYHLNAQQIPHLFIAMEMTPMEIEMRQVARSLNVSPSRIIRGKSAQYPVNQTDAVNLVPNTPNCTIYEGRPGATLDEIERMIFSAHQRHGVKGVMLDYWQLVGGKSPRETEEWHLRNVAQRLADLTRRLGIWCVTACQLNQEGNSRGGEGIKLACDAYMSLHRDKGMNTAWIDLEECRYGPYGTLGSDINPGLILNEHGPYFEQA